MFLSKALLLSALLVAFVGLPSEARGCIECPDRSLPFGACGSTDSQTCYGYGGPASGGASCPTGYWCCEGANNGQC
jgi:hypothetical protein